MAFEGLSEKLQNVFKGLKGKGSLTESDINTAMREVKLALLEADVNFKVVKVRVRRLPAENWRHTLRKTGKSLCCVHVTFTDRLL